MMETLLRDARRAARGLARTPAGPSITTSILPRLGPTGTVKRIRPTSDRNRAMDSRRPPDHPHHRGIQRLDRPRRVILRDFIVYEIKLLLDGIKDVGISFLALAAVAFDMVSPGQSPGRRFYAVMRLGERLDRWLSLYGVAEAAERDPEGMFGVSRAGSPTLLGRLEALIHDAMVGEEDESAEVSAPTGPGEGPTEESDGTGAEDDLFSRGIAVLDRAVDVLDRDGPTPPAPPPTGSEAAQRDEAPPRGGSTGDAPRRDSRPDVPPSSR